jgi:phage baseplate assembly protein V
MLELLRELNERIQTLESYRPIRIGEVVAVYPEKAAARVKFLDMDEETSYELQILHPHTYKDKLFWMPRIGEKIVCLMLNSTDGFIVGAYYHKDCPPPGEDGNRIVITFEDGTQIEYDKSAHNLTVDVAAGNVNITVNGGNGVVTVNGNLYVTQNIKAGGDIYDHNGEHGSVATLRSTYNSHTHTGDSGGTTSAPNQTV